MCIASEGWDYGYEPCEQLSDVHCPQQQIFVLQSFLMRVLMFGVIVFCSSENDLFIFFFFP